jgi:hypothetical protein
LDTSVLPCLDTRFDTFACLDADSSLARLAGYLVCGHLDVHFNASRSTMLTPSMLVHLDLGYFHAWPILLLASILLESILTRYSIISFWSLGRLTLQ